MKKLLIYFAALVAMLSSVSCETVFSEEEMPQQFVPYGEVIMDEAYYNLSFGGNAETQTITFTSNDDWKILTTQKWVEIPIASGEAGTHTVEISVTKSYEDSERASTLTFVIERLRETFSLKQAKGNVMLPDVTSIGPLATAETQVDVEATYNAAFNVGYDFGESEKWIGCDYDDVTIPAPDEMTQKTIEFDIYENDTYNDRSATVSFYNDDLDTKEEFAVSQEGKVAVVLADYQSIIALAAEDTYSVDCWAAIDFDVTTDVEWIDLTQMNKTLESNRFKFDFGVLAHEDKSTTREGHIFLTNVEESVVRTITVTQDEYNDDAYITVTAAGGVSAAIAQLLVDKPEIALADYNRVYITGVGVALNAIDFTTITTSLSGIKLIDISNTATTEIPASQYTSKSNIQQFIFPETIETIGDYAFQATGLTSVTIPGGSGKTTTGYRSFYNCLSLTEVVLEEGVTVMGQQVFQGCTSLTKAIVPSTIEEWLPADVNNRAFYLTGLTDLTLTEGLKSLGPQAFYGVPMESVTIPGSIESYPLNANGVNVAFYMCPSLKEITISNGLRVFDSTMFNNCYYVESIYMPALVPTGTSVGPSVGRDGAGLTLYVPSSSYDSYVWSDWASYTIVAVD